ncbi:hypothetical protein GPALN_011228 [Globodera pallida]|nr:hypothetical protein GPALN_011228 [Globodera pallida]
MIELGRKAKGGGRKEIQINTQSSAKLSSSEAPTIKAIGRANGARNANSSEVSVGVGKEMGGSAFALGGGGFMPLIFFRINPQLIKRSEPRRIFHRMLTAADGGEVWLLNGKKRRFSGGCRTKKTPRAKSVNTEKPAGDEEGGGKGAAKNAPIPLTQKLELFINYWATKCCPEGKQTNKNNGMRGTEHSDNDVIRQTETPGGVPTEQVNLYRRQQF